MKKSVLLPFERYQQLLDNSSSSSSSSQLEATGESIAAATASTSPGTTTAASRSVLPEATSTPPPPPIVRGSRIAASAQSPPLPPPPPAQSPPLVAPPTSLDLYKSRNKLAEGVITACLPKRNHFKARRLLDYINRQPHLDWNQAGNLIVDNQTVEYSHIVDLLHDALNSTRSDPVGHDVFYQQLVGVPQSLINNPRRKSLVGNGRRRRLPPPGLPSSQPIPLNAWRTQWQAL